MPCPTSESLDYLAQLTALAKSSGGIVWVGHEEMAVLKKVVRKAGTSDADLQRAVDDLRDTLVRMGLTEEEADARLVEQTRAVLATEVKQTRMLRSRGGTSRVL